MPITKKTPVKNIKKIRKPIVVHLGNVGEKTKAGGKTERYAKKFKSTKFIGIDLRHKKSNKKNWIQKQADFVKGLEALKDGSVKIISSEMGIGYYGKPKKTPTWNPKEVAEYTKQTINLCYRKLAKGGKLHFVVEFRMINFINGIINQTPFDVSKKKLRLVDGKVENRTFWMKEYTQQGVTLLEFTLQK